MPTYEYHCPSNGQTLEVRHKMSEKLMTWGELCERAGVQLEGTPAETPIKRNILGGQLMLKQNGSGRTQMAERMQEVKQSQAPSRPACCGGGCSGHSH
jgi:predicted nucleic acid-binding Zn ribbon protein